VLCFKKLDPGLSGCIPVSSFDVLFAMLQQNEIIGSKSKQAAAIARLDPEGTNLIHLGPFLTWVSLEDQPDSKTKSKDFCYISLLSSD
jgi:hypothetical protein